jgi:hypothetical protein
MPMKIELLHFDGCPSWVKTQEDIRAVLADRGLSDQVALVNVRSNEEAQELRFVGSPSVRIDGRDIDPETPDSGFNLECRIYWVNGRAAGVPPVELIERAVDAAKT